MSSHASDWLLLSIISSPRRQLFTSSSPAARPNPLVCHPRSPPPLPYLPNAVAPHPPPTTAASPPPPQSLRLLVPSPSRRLTSPPPHLACTHKTSPGPCLPSSTPPQVASCDPPPPPLDRGSRQGGHLKARKPQLGRHISTGIKEQKKWEEEINPRKPDREWETLKLPEICQRELCSRCGFVGLLDLVSAVAAASRYHHFTLSLRPSGDPPARLPSA
jgi:hypothetical protein